MEFWIMAAGPASINSIAAKLLALDFDLFHSGFVKYCSDTNEDTFVDYENDFHGYVFQWRDAVLEAQTMNWGVLGHMG